ncbi:hypothetical protein CLF_101263 [Clonorchis sinensis]|uniref:Uncharacterized protein n=1 Tax=Clonorchis sinensis TaxID=79923 RepID=G7Y5D2_CLOSI|nr:hypothetical protein CLF_101263 [Clonorchis sinensis]
MAPLKACILRHDNNPDLSRQATGFRGGWRNGSFYISVTLALFIILLKFIGHNLIDFTVLVPVNDCQLSEITWPITSIRTLYWTLKNLTMCYLFSKHLIEPKQLMLKMPAQYPPKSTEALIHWYENENIGGRQFVDLKRQETVYVTLNIR